MPTTLEDWIVRTKQDVMDHVLMEMRNTGGRLSACQYTNFTGAHCAVGACLSPATLARIAIRTPVDDVNNSRIAPNVLGIRALVERHCIVARPPAEIGLDFMALLQDRNDTRGYLGVCALAEEHGLKLPEDWKLR